jgi:hypothetical protein
MSCHVLAGSGTAYRGTPLGVAGRGLVAGLAGTVLLSLHAETLMDVDMPQQCTSGESLTDNGMFT